MAQLELYEVPDYPSCATVRKMLDELDLEYESRTVPCSHGKRGELVEISGQTQVPVLVDHENGHTQTPRDGDIAAYVETTYGKRAVAPE